MPLVLGLGNPGRGYARTRHNVGWRVVERLVDRMAARPGASAVEYRAWRATVAEKEVDLVVPLTFMNRTGEALESWRGRHELSPGDLLAIADDVYLPAGMLRIRSHGSSGGHRGLESIEAVLGTREYARLRIGVGHADAAELRGHVLEAPAADEEELIDRALGQAADAVDSWICEGLIATMNRFNRKGRKEASES